MDILTLAIALGYTKKQVEEAKREGFRVQVEQDRSILETTGEEKVFYFLPKNPQKTRDGYDEFIYANNSWEQVGVTDIDLSAYALKEDIGDLDDLPTTDKSSLVGAISETFTSVSNGKAIVASAITDKGVPTSSDATFSTMAQNIENIPTGGGIKPQKVNFYDFKGNLSHSYTAEEAAALTEMPEAPTIEGFTFQKWNWTLEKIKTWLQNHDEGELSVGGLYVTSDGHTRIRMTLREAELARIEMPFCIQQMAGTVVIDWGDNSQPETITAAGIYSHLWQVSEYPANVVIDIEYTPSDSTKLVLGRDSANAGLFNGKTYYAGCVTALHLGSNTDIGNASVGRNCRNLTEVNIPDGITSIGSNAFQGCTNLALTVLPDGITSIGGSTFQGCTNLALTALPDGVTIIGSSAFNGCTNLALTVLPDGVTSIGGSTFLNCTNLALTALPDGVTSIGYNAFQNCSNLALTALPDGLTSIGNSAFQGCTSLYIIDLTAFTNPQSIPTLANANAFQGIPAEAQFQVSSQGMYDAFTTATNWSTYASQFIIKGAA